MKHLRYGFLVLLVFFCINGSLTASAADDRVGTTVDGSLLTEGTSAEFENEIGNTLARWNYLAYGKGSICLSAAKTFSIYVATVCHYDVDTVKVKFYLQKLVGSTWTTLYTSATKVAYNTYFISSSMNYTVGGGAYYRLKSTHTVIHDGTTESATNSSNGIWVD